MSPLIVGGRTIFGALSSQPTGITTTAGSEYYDTTDSAAKIWTGSSWSTQSTAAALISIGSLDGTLMYFDFGNYSGSSWQGNTSAATLTNIETSGASGGVNIPRGSASYNSSNGGILRGSSTQDCRATLSGTNPLGQSISMGVVIRFDAASDGSTTPSRGMIYYGNTASDQHFYIRKNINGANMISIGQDTNGSDVWTTTTSSYTSASGFTVFIYNLAPDGTLSYSVNGAAFAQVRSGGGAIGVTTPYIGFFGDPYNDNASNFDIGAGFWRSQLTTDSEASDWYQYLKSNYGAGVNRFSLT